MKKELEKDPALKNENWDRFLPKFKKYDNYLIILLLYVVTIKLKTLLRRLHLYLWFTYNFFRKNVKQKKVKSKEKKPYTPFPPPQPPSKVKELRLFPIIYKYPARDSFHYCISVIHINHLDFEGTFLSLVYVFPKIYFVWSLACYILQYLQVDMQLETGEYFWSNQKKQAKKWQEKQEKQAEKTAENKRKREAAFIPPEVLFHNSFSQFYPFFPSLIFMF